jgi:hypothetical protein
MKSVLDQMRTFSPQQIHHNSSNSHNKQYQEHNNQKQQKAFLASAILW